MPVVRVESAEDPRLVPFGSIADPAALTSRGLVAIEGRLVVERALVESPVAFEALLLSEGAHEAMSAVLTRAPAALPVYVVPRPWMEAITGFNLHRGCVAIARRPASRSLADLLEAGARRLLVLEGVANPDNVGGLFRTARAFGVDAIVLGPGCGDPLYRKAIRVSCGAALVVPWAEADRWPEALETIKARRIALLALSPAAHLARIDSVATARPAGRPIAIMVGAEGAGLTDAALARADVVARIPVDPRSDSLNVTVAAGVALHLLR